MWLIALLLLVLQVWGHIGWTVRFDDATVSVPGLCIPGRSGVPDHGLCRYAHVSVTGSILQRGYELADAKGPLLFQAGQRAAGWRLVPKATDTGMTWLTGLLVLLPGAMFLRWCLPASWRRSMRQRLKLAALKAKPLQPVVNGLRVARIVFSGFGSALMVAAMVFVVFDWGWAIVAWVVGAVVVSVRD